MPAVEIRLLNDVAEYRECERIQTQVWGTPGATSEIMSAIQKYGGAVIGAFAGKRLKGFILAFLGQYHGRMIHWSHMMAVEAKCRDQGFGLQMKMVHRQIALARGIKSICWTFDPLQSRNARLNIARLGALPEEYVANCYGRFPSLLEKGLPSDRWVVNWRIASPRVERRLRGEHPIFPRGLPLVNETRPGMQGFPENRKVRLNLTQRRLLVEIPGQTDAMRSQAMPHALRWRMEVRRIFQSYLARGYRVQEFYPPHADTAGRSLYLLQKHA
jgi:predicted GNAT superfamily acetyltransferase